MSFIATNYGSVSGIIHLIARRPVLAATIALVAVSVAYVPKMPPPPPTPLPPAVVTYTAPAPEVTSEDGPPTSATVPFYDATCQFGTKAVVTNLCKAELDTAALWLQSNPNESVVVRGTLNNAIGVRHYLTSGESKFGIAPARISIDADDTLGTEVIIRER